MKEVWQEILSGIDPVLLRVIFLFGTVFLIILLGLLHAFT